SSASISSCAAIAPYLAPIASKSSFAYREYITLASLNVGSSLYAVFKYAGTIAENQPWQCTTSGDHPNFFTVSNTPLQKNNERSLLSAKNSPFSSRKTFFR